MANVRYRADYYLFRHFLVGMGSFHDDKVSSHGAMKLVFGINGPFRIRLGGRWYDARAAMLDGGVPHYLNGDGDWQVVIWVEGSTSLGMALGARSLKGRDWALHGVAASPALDEVIQTAGDDPDSAGALSIAETLIRVYGGIKAIPSTWDEDVKKAVDAVDSTPGVWSGRSLAESLGRSVSDLNADFRRVLGIGLDDYLHARKRVDYIARRQKGVGRQKALESAGLPGWEGLKDDFRERFGLDLGVLEESLPFVSVYEGRDSGPVLYL
jgi:hypothetical protein